MNTFQLHTITAHIRDTPDITAKALANHFGYSQSHFSREFKKQMGVSLRDYLSAVKVERGLHDFVDSNNVTNAQLEAGYENIGAFSHAFKQFSGLSPKSHLKDISNYVRGLNTLKPNIFKDYILYAPFQREQHLQPHALHIHVHNRQFSNSLIFVALYPQALPKGTPNLGICMKHQTDYLVTHVPDSTYYVMAVEIEPSRQLSRLLKLDDCYRAISREPYTFPLPSNQSISLSLREKIPSDPPLNVNPIKFLFDALSNKITK